MSVTIALAQTVILHFAAIVFDDVPQRVWEVMVGSWCLFGVIMQIAAGATARLRFAGKAVG